MEVHPMSAPVVSIQPGMFTCPVGLKTEVWNSGIYDCCQDMGICCFGLWCPWCQACQISSNFGECLCMPLVDLCTGGMVPAASLAMRSAMRERYHIQGSMFDDCCIVTFCNVCAWCQMAREMKLRKHPLLINAGMQVTINPLPNAPNYPPQSQYPIPAGLYPPVSYPCDPQGREPSQLP